MESSTDLGIADCDESIPLLNRNVNVQKTVTVNARNIRDVTIRSVIICGAYCLQIISYVITQVNVLTQYAYFAIQKQYFSNVTFNATEPERSNCINASSATLEIDNEIQAIASDFLIYTTLALFVPSMLANFFFATFSDSYGRKPFMIVPVAGSFIKCLLFCIGIYCELNLYFFILFVFVEGISGGIFFMLSLAQSYMADITESGKNRVLLIAIIEIVSGLGGTYRIYLIRLLDKEFWISDAMFHFFLLFISRGCYGTFLFARVAFTGRSINRKNIENMPKIKGSSYILQQGNRERKAMAIYHLFDDSFLHWLQHPRPDKRRKSISVECAILLDFGTPRVVFGLTRFFSYVVGLSLIRFLQWCFSDELISIFGTVSILTSFLLEAFAETNVQLILVPFVGFGAAMIGPLVRAIMSRMTPTDKQGTLFAGIGMNEALCMIIGSTLSNVIYSATVQTTRGFVFLVFSRITGVALVLLIILCLGNYLTQDNDRFIDRENTVETKIE